ncbi:MAG: WG repeat-containing protein, partial [Bacteroidia bacterium]|nr:WG repeat-containing protein [Bacteroidia bacterium]
LIPLKFEMAGSFKHNLANVKTGGKWGYIDPNGKMVIDAKYDYAGMFVEGKAQVKLDDKEFYIYPDGRRVHDAQSASAEKPKQKEESKPANEMEALIARMKERDEQLKAMDKNYKGSDIKSVEDSYEKLKTAAATEKNKITAEVDALFQLVRTAGNKNLNEIKEMAGLLGANNFVKTETQAIHPLTRKQEKCTEHKSIERILDKSLGLSIYEFASGDFSIFLFLKNPYFKNLNDRLPSSGLKFIEKNGSWQYWGNDKAVIRLVDADGPAGNFGGDCSIYNR